MKFSRFAAVVLSILASATISSAQTQPNLETGYKPYGSYDATSIDSINTMNGDLMVHIALPFSYPQRGNRLSLPVYLQANSKGWHVNSYSYPCSGTCVAFGWGNPPGGIQLVTTPTMAISRVRQIDSAYDGGGVSYDHFGYTITTRDGASHPLSGNPATADSTGEPWSFDAADTSGLHVDLSTGGVGGFPTTATVTDRNGNRYQFGTFGGACKTNTSAGAEGAMPPTHGGFNNYGADTITTCRERAAALSATDANGNVINFGSLDTLGRNPVSAASTTDYSGCVGPVSSAMIYTFLAYNGSAQLKLCSNPPNVTTAFNVPNVAEYPNWPGATNYDAPWPARSWVTTAVLPDGSKYTFSYDNYGEITSIGLPTGGSIAYTWTTMPLSPCGDPTSASRAVASRSINDGFGHIQTWNYTYTLLSANLEQTVVSDPNHNDTVHIFSPVDNGGCMLYETSTRFYTGSSTGSGRPLKQIDTHYVSALVRDESGYANGMPGNIVPDSIKTTVYPSSKVMQVTKSYDVAQSTTGVIFGNVVTEKVYDWGQGAPGALLRETDTTYKWQADSGYLTPHLLDLPASVIVKDGSGNRVAENDYGYDEYTDPSYLTPANISTQHVAPPYGVRGNQTTASHWLNTNNSLITSHTKWYDTGERFQTLDPLGHTTTYSYDPAYAGGYVTQTCSPTTSGVSHCVSGTYELNTGLLTSFTNENATTQASGNSPGDSAHTSSYTYDSMLRLTSALAPPDPANNGAQAQNTLTFSPGNTFPMNVQRSKSVTTALSDVATAFFDGLGRGYKGQHALPNGTSTVDATFDPAGNVSTVSNPYFSTSESTYGITTNAYDGLDRVTQTTKQDGSISKAKYSVATTVAANGDCNISTDEAGKQRGACTDALGRLVEVDEPNSALMVSVNYHATMQQDGNFVLFNSANNSLWSTGTGGTNAGPIMMQDDGNLVLYTFKWQAGTYAAPTPGSYPAQSCGSKAYLNTGDRLNSGQCIVSPHGQYILYMAPDGNFFIYDIAHGAATWGANTYGHPGAYAVMQSDGNFCIYAADNTFLWMSGTNGTGAERLNLEDDGRIIIYKSVWNSGTATGQFNWAQLAHPSCDAGSGTGWTGVLGSGQCWVSPNGHFELLLQADGNLVLNDLGTTPARMLWSTDTAVSPADPGFALRTLYTYDVLGNLTCVEQHGDATTGTGCSADPSNDATSPWRMRRFTYDSLSRLLTARNPESGTISYVYDNDGNLLQKTSPAPNQTGSATQTVSFCYDELHRVTGKTYGAQSCPLSSPVVSYAYDSGANAKGKLTQMADQAGTATYSYDMLGRLSSETRTLTGANSAGNPISVSKAVSYDYNLDGSLKALHYPSGAVITYTPDSAGRMLSAVDSGNGINYVTGATYGPDNGLTGFVSGSGGPAAITSNFSYNKRLQPVTMSASTASQTVFSIGYDFHAGNGTPGSGSDNGNVFGIYNYRDRSRDQSFSYDALNRLVSAQNAGTNCSAMTVNNKTEYWGNSYSYDAWGNLLGKTVTKCGAENLGLTADAHNWIHASGTDYQYDAAGNMTYDATAHLNYAFDQENRITGANGYTYTYDGDGNRVRKSNGNLAANGTLYWYMTPGVVAESDLSGTLKSEYVFFDGERVARKDYPGDTVAYYFSDHLKTASVITDAAGTIKAESDYYPWGGELQFVNNDSNDYKFTGKKRDVETGLDYFGARYYSNGLGRWVSPDWAAKATAVPYAEFADPQSLNLYSYVRNIPTTRFDVDGHEDNRSTWEKVRDAVRDFFMQAQPSGAPQLPPPSSRGCSCPEPQKQDDKNQNNSQRSNTQEQGRDAQGKFLPKQAGQSPPGSAAEREALDAVGATKNTKAIPGSNRIPDGKIGEVTNGGQYVEVKSGAYVSDTAQLKQMAAAAVKATGRPLRLVTTNPNVQFAKSVLRNENIEIVRLNQK